MIIYSTLLLLSVNNISLFKPQPSAVDLNSIKHPTKRPVVSPKLKLNSLQRVKHDEGRQKP